LREGEVMMVTRYDPSENDANRRCYIAGSETGILPDRSRSRYSTGEIVV